MGKRKERPRVSVKVAPALLEQVRVLAKQEGRMVTFELDLVIQAGIKAILERAA